MIRQTLAIFVDAYRELNAKKMFWIVLGLSVLCVAALACLGVYERPDGPNGKEAGVTILWWKFPIDVFKVMHPTPKLFYNLLFFQVGFKTWLTWAATVLALISTAGMVPDFISSGAVDLVLAKPIGRARLFLTKYLAGLMFVALQVTVFSVGAFLVIGIRGGAWEPVLFLGIPIVLAFFSYLFAFEALIGLLTKSAIASLLITLCLWIAVFAINSVETQLVLEAKIRQDQAVAIREDDVSKLRERIGALEKAASPGAGEGPSKPAGADELPELRQRLAEREAKLAEFRDDQTKLTRIHTALFAAKTVLPKTTETVDLLQRALVSKMEIEGLIENTPEPPRRKRWIRDELQPSETSVRREMQETLRGRSVGWVLGTSLVFEGVVLGIATWIFARRDF